MTAFPGYTRHNAIKHAVLTAIDFNFGGAMDILVASPVGSAIGYVYLDSQEVFGSDFASMYANANFRKQYKYDGAANKYVFAEQIASELDDYNFTNLVSVVTDDNYFAFA